MIHFIYTPFLGRGKIDKGEKWLKERIEIFKEHTLKSLLNQTNKNFTHWISWRPKDKTNKQVEGLKEYLRSINYNFVFTYGGLAIWDDRKKREKTDLPKRLKTTLLYLTPLVRGSKYIYQTILDSDDVYEEHTVEEIQRQPYREGAFGYKNGFVINYSTGEMAEWNPLTCPPFYTIMFPEEVFLSPIKHLDYTGWYESHEYVPDKLEFKYLPSRRYGVGTHGNNLGTTWNHRFRGKII
jgi:hypothetical protein